jgi:polygalacturonase
MLVERVHVSVGDDAVAITSGEMYQGRTFGIPSENMIFRDSVFLHRFFAIGSGTAAGVRNITVENCQLGAAPGDGFGAEYGPSDDAGINIKTERGNGGWIEDITFRNLVIHGRVDGKWQQQLACATQPDPSSLIQN